MKIILILTSVLLGVFGQVLFKMAVKGHKSSSFFDIMKISISSFSFWGGLIFYSVSLVLWMKVLSNTDLSYARPFAGIGYVLTALLSWFIFGENLSFTRWVGIFLIFFGVFLVSRT